MHRRLKELLQHRWWGGGSHINQVAAKALELGGLHHAPPRASAEEGSSSQNYPTVVGYLVLSKR